MRVHRVVSAIDPGHVVNPLSIEMQTQGAIVYALTAALYGEITIKDGAAEQSNFDTYEMLRLADAPVVETVIVPSGDFWGGVGEPPVPPLAPALVQRHLRRHRQAHPLAAAEKSGFAPRYLSEIRAYNLRSIGRARS